MFDTDLPPPLGRLKRSMSRSKSSLTFQGSTPRLSFISAHWSGVEKAFPREGLFHFIGNDFSQAKDATAVLRHTKEQSCLVVCCPDNKVLNESCPFLLFHVCTEPA